MILLLSQSAGEPTTEKVMDWLEHFGASYLRLNGSDVNSGATDLEVVLADDGVRARLRDEAHDLLPDEVDVVWFRRWQHDRPYESMELFAGDPPDRSQAERNLIRSLDFELDRLSTFLVSRYPEAEWLTELDDAVPNKLRILEQAKRVGLDIPATLVTNTRAALEVFVRQHPRLITKAISESIPFTLDNKPFFLYTTEVDSESIEELPEKFFPSLFQECLDKEYEIRVFFLGGECHAMAIFSQLDEQTQVDFRMYNYERPNRKVPYQLPAELEERIRDLMGHLDLETGSLDFVRTRDGRDVFLEVNPIGQFGMVSSPCNYHLERRVAEYLLEKDGHDEKG